MTSDVNKIENKIKDLNEIRAIYHRNLEEFERQYNEKKISTKHFEKHKIDYDKKREKIRKEIHILEEKLEQLKK
jgi:chromosome segregation ATPase